MTSSSTQDSSEESGAFLCSCGREMYVVAYLVVNRDTPSFAAICPDCDGVPMHDDVMRPNDPRNDPSS